MPSKSKRKSARRSGPRSPDRSLRIIGGTFGGRKLLYSGDPRTRPMKERVREAIFNLLGPAVQGKHALDLFAGTGALGLEALSRGAKRATFLERHFPSADLIRKNVAALGIADVCQVLSADTFHWIGRKPALGKEPVVAFISPPYDYYVDRRDDMLSLIHSLLLDQLPAESLLVVEADERFDFAQLPRPGDWDVRQYPPAVVGIL